MTYSIDTINEKDRDFVAKVIEALTAFSPDIDVPVIHLKPARYLAGPWRIGKKLLNLRHEFLTAARSVLALTKSVINPPEKLVVISLNRAIVVVVPMRIYKG